VRGVLLLLVLGAGGALAADIEPGSWEMTVTTSIDGMPGMAPIVQTRCLTGEDARDPSRLVGGAGCDFSNRRDTGSEYSFNVSCGGQLPMSGSGVVRYSPQTLDAALELSADSAGQKIMTRSRVVGRRLGGC
jgi:hypothetical protein